METWPSSLSKRLSYLHYCLRCAHLRQQAPLRQQRQQQFPRNQNSLQFYVKRKDPRTAMCSLGGDGGGICSNVHDYADKMTDALRNEYVRLHNFRRSLLAKGHIPRKDGKYLPKAANMWKMSYDCNLEAEAIQYASTCPPELSKENSRPNLGENLKKFPATRFTFGTAAKKSVTEWWKTIRGVNYFKKAAVFRPFHDGKPISSFTQMGWALSNKLGCSIVKCTTENRYVGVCRYSPRGNTVNSTIYQVGNPCSLNPGNGATTCNTAEGLWS
ncbi:hypothetical protein Y032_0177g624 [Ancylostoma ceylanicum]|uniref:SCP domain-containing protein n=1 Tax=Ancylostoma ceylanicum TaxID=53326 RepID=A0A016STZ1_9BILA|nr:hypothetical protein Y032_0177g624 [Ancylostoma ceylanicum]